MRWRTNAGYSQSYLLLQIAAQPLPRVATMWVLQEAGYVRPALELSLDDHKVSSGSIGHDKDGTTTFAFTIGPLPKATVTALEGVAGSHGRICLFCCRQPLVLELLKLERKDARKLRIEGRVVAGAA